MSVHTKAPQPADAVAAATRARTTYHPLPWRIGGYVLSYEQLIELSGKLRPDVPVLDMLSAFRVVMLTVRRGGFLLMLSGTKPGEFLAGDVIFVSRLAKFKRGHDGLTEFPMFEPNDRDEAARKLLAEHGLANLEYTTRLCGVCPLV